MFVFTNVSIPAWFRLVWLLILLIAGAGELRAQWSGRASLPATPRSRSSAFALNNKIYVVGGMASGATALNDCWEYDVLSDTWSQKAVFPGASRYSSVSFTLGGKGYLCAGDLNGTGYTNELWEYDPALDSWTQKAPFPSQRAEALAFTIGSKAYVGFGDGFITGPNNTSNVAYFDLYAYDQVTDTWTPVAPLPDSKGRTMAAAAVLNGKAYVGLGCNAGQDVNYAELWEYDPLSDSWTQRASLPGAFTTDAGAVAHNNYIYIIGGVNLNPVALSDQVYRYAPLSDTWETYFYYNAGPVAGGLALQAGGRCFAGTGFDGSLNTRNDWWELTDENLSMSGFSLTAGVACAQQTLSAMPQSTLLPAQAYSWTAQPPGGVSFVPSATVSAPEVICQVPGTYTLSCSAYSMQLSTSSTAVLNVSACMGLTEKSIAGLQVSPNPSEGIFYMKGTGIESGPAHITVTDISGRIVLIETAAELQSFRIDLSGQGRGVYFLHVEQGHASRITKLILN